MVCSVVPYEAKVGGRGRSFQPPPDLATLNLLTELRA